MMRYKVGDKVRIRKDLSLGHRYRNCLFTKSMYKLRGGIACITAVYERNEMYSIAGSLCYWTDEMFEDVDMEVQEMHKSVIINVFENKVIASCDCKIGVARCHPDDEFDFFVGAKIALERLEEAEKPYGWLKKGMEYYTANIDSKSLYASHLYVADELDKRYMKLGIVFLTKEEAIECAKKMLAAVKQEVGNEN